VGIDPDSGIFVSAGRSLLSGNGYSLYTGEPLTIFPPLFPTLLAVFGLVGIEPLDAAKFLNALAFGLIVFTSGQLFRMAIKSSALVILGSVSILLSYPLLDVSIYAMSDALFVLLAVLFTICIMRFANQGGLISVFLLSILAALCCLQRYIGVTIVFTGFVLMIVIPRIRFLERLKYAMLFSVMSLSPLALWVLRNWSLTSTITGTRPPSQRTLLWNTLLSFWTVTTWFIPRQAHFWLFLIGAAFVICVLLAVAHLLLSERNTQVSVELTHLWAPGVFVLIYAAFLITSITTVAVEPIADRYLAPIYVFVMFLVFVSMDRFTQPVETICRHRFFGYSLRLLSIAMILSGILGNEFVVAHYLSSDGVLEASTISGIRRLQAILVLGGIMLLARTRIAILQPSGEKHRTGIQDRTFLNLPFRHKELRSVAIIGLCAIWLMYPLVRVSKDLLERTRNGAGGYSTTAWRNSPLMEWIRIHPLEGNVYTNSPFAIYLLNDQCARLSPRKHEYQSRATMTDDIPKLTKVLASKSQAYLVWFNIEKKYDYLYSVEELRSIFNLETVATYPDGEVYLVKQE
jgi:hypothetical protein